MSSPGAARSTDFEPKFEKLARPPFAVVAATVRMLPSVKEAGYCGCDSRLSPSLPAATTSSTPLDFAGRTSSCSAVDFFGEPNEQLMTFAFMCTAYSRPATASEVEPFPRAFMNRTGISFADQQTPETPVPLFDLAPTVPATWVPWPSSSAPDSDPFSAFK